MLPRDYDDLLKYISEKERYEYTRLAVQLQSKEISEDEFNKKHQEFFDKLEVRKNQVTSLIQKQFPPEDYHYLQDHEKEQYRQTVIWFKTDFIDIDQFAFHTEDLRKQINYRKETAKWSIPYDKNDDGDQISGKLGGGCHADDGIQEHESYNGKTWERYYTRRNRKIDPRDVSTFFEVKS